MSQVAGKTVQDSTNNPRTGFLWAKIYTPFVTYFEGEAKSVSAKNDSGYFDILAEHHNFITMLLACDVKVEDANGEHQEIPIRRGLLHIKDNRLIIFLDV